MKKIFLFIQVTATLSFVFLILNNYFIVDKGSIENINNSSKKEFSSSNFYNETSQPIISYLIKEEDLNTNITYKNTKKLCDYTKFPFGIITPKKINKDNYEIAPSIKTICINKTTDLSNNAIQKILSFVNNGGSIIITNTINDKRFNYLIGLKKNRNQHVYNNTAKGFFFKNDFLPNLNTSTLYEDVIHYGFSKKSFTKNINVIIPSVNEKTYPVILENSIGLGKVIFYNSSLEISKFERGILFSSLLSTLEEVPYPIANVNTIFLDDFPSPTYPFKREPVVSEFNVSNQEFVNKIWWPDMLKLAKKHTLKYTATIIFDYEENTVPPFSLKEWNSSKLNNIPIPHLLTNALLDNNHELGFHGYNHVSLLKKNWTPKNTEIALQTVKKIWTLNDYKKLPTSYIPPSNYIDKFGIASLNRHLSSIKYMCSLYTGEFIKGGGREYDPEPYSRNLFDFPRVTSGFYLNNSKKYLKESVYLFTGIWSHFVHPDDIYQIPSEDNAKTRGKFSYRNSLNLNWKEKNKKGIEGMYQQFDNLIKTHKKNYPLTTFPDVRTAGKTVTNIRSNSYKHTIEKHFYTVSNLKKEKHKQDWFLYISNKKKGALITYLKEKNILFSSLPIHKGVLLNIKTDTQEIKIPLYKNKLQKDRIGFYKTLQDYNTYINFKEKEASFITVSQKMKLLRKELLSSKKIDKEKWKTYAKYCSWEKKEHQFWSDLEQYYYINKNYETAMLSEELAKVIWYFSKGDREKWLGRQILTATTSKIKLALINIYIKNFNTKDNLKAIIDKFKIRATLNPTSKNKVAYISLLLWNKQPETIAVLNELPPSNDYKEIAKDIAWHFHKKGNIKKALAWAHLTNEIPINTKLYWLFNSKKYAELENYYNTYIQHNKNDDLAKITMSYFYLSRKKIKESWIIASTINSDYSDYNSIQKELNGILKYQDINLQEDIINNYDTSFLLDKVKENIKRLIVLQTNNSISFTSSLDTYRNDIAYFDKSITYSKVSKKLHVHSLSATNTLIASNNKVSRGKELYGLQYKFENSRMLNNKLNYYTKLRVETDKGKYYYKFGMGGSYNLKKNFISLSYNVFPVKNSVAYNENLYKNQFGIYAERVFKNRANLLMYIESNYYSNHQKNISYNVAANQPIYKFGSQQIRATIEGSYALGSTNFTSGLPFFMLKKRLFGGGGFQYLFNTDVDKTNVFIDALTFSDSHAGLFTRFRSQVNFQLKKYFIVNFKGELFLNKQYYSNSFNVGLTYYIK
ncbi:hypothetical protein CXF68_00930 [Tenacibaculum sp. Bg11-29]|uniref:DUF2194 domain-containing protein n=1 Tax=Tenacibaculum sp. Bg11-29 TaxID=2058306 RepID=UPI000C342B62|nr:DUF2194 domain-containing protein [Tenacibaculum sp. Bg11-29]PKH49336.1 hypothetical protein CXF68_00930 [Tenacibaculum sp. Bg11-29]